MRITQRTCHGCGEFFNPDEFVCDGTHSFCHACWDEMSRREALIEQQNEGKAQPEDDDPFSVIEAAKPAAVDELKRLLFDTLKKKRGVVRFAYVKLDGTLRHAKAEFKVYVPKGGERRERAPDIITYWDGDRHDYRCFHEEQMVDGWPQWSKN